MEEWRSARGRWARRAFSRGSRAGRGAAGAAGRVAVAAAALAAPLAAVRVLAVLAGAALLGGASRGVLVGVAAAAVVAAPFNGSAARRPVDPPDGAPAAALGKIRAAGGGR